MVMSILNDTKKVLGLDSAYTPFDIDVLIHINATLSILSQIGVLTDAGYNVSNAEDIWDDLNLSIPLLSLVKSYIYLKVKMLFDPPGTSFLIEAVRKQTEEFEWRLRMLKEYEDGN